MAALGLCCCVCAFSSCGEWGLLFAVVGGLRSCGSRALELRISCGAQALLFHGMWDLPRPGLERVSPALAGRFLSTAPPGKSDLYNF